jgi:hypothetical protein
MNEFQIVSANAQLLSQYVDYGEFLKQMRKPTIVLTCIGMALAALIAAPFAANQWITVIERNHAYERELNTERAEKAQAEAQARAAEEQAEAGIKEAFENSEADEFANDPEGFRKHNPNITRDEFRETYDRAKARWLARSPELAGRDFDNSRPSYEELYGPAQAQH